MATPTRPAAAIRYDMFEGSFPGIAAPPTTPEPEEQGTLKTSHSVHDLSSLHRRSVRRATSINPLHCVEAASLRNLTTIKLSQHSSEIDCV